MRAPPLVRLLCCAFLSASCGGGDLTLPGPDEPASLRIVAGDQQSAQAGQQLDQPLVVEVRDGLQRPVAGAGVTFRFTDDVPEAVLTPAAAPTDDLGRASAQARLGSRAGAQDIEALVATGGEDLRVRFNLTALAEGGGGGGGGGADDDGGAGPPPPGGGGDGGGGSGGGGGDGGSGGDGGDGGNRGGGEHGGDDDGGGKGDGHGRGQGDDHQGED